MSQTDRDAFDPDDFMTRVSQMVEAKIEECVNSIKKGLLKEKNPALTEESLREVHDLHTYFFMFLSVASQYSDLYLTYFTFTHTVLHQPCKKLREFMREEFGKNLNKFELYTKRNIFVESTGEESNHEQIEIDKEIQEVKDQAAKLADLRQKYAEMSNEYKEAEQMLADMKSSLFGIH